MVRKLKYACDFEGIRTERKNNKADGGIIRKDPSKTERGWSQHCGKRIFKKRQQERRQR